MGDNELPTSIIDEPWQTPGSIYGETWGYRSWQERKDLAGKTNEHLLNLVKIVSRGGNYILNIGPRGDGTVVEFEADVLRGVGTWVKANAEAVYRHGRAAVSRTRFRLCDHEAGAAVSDGHEVAV